MAFVPHVRGFVSCSSGVTTAVPFGTDGTELEYFDSNIMDNKIVEETKPQHGHLMSQESGNFWEEGGAHSHLKTWRDTSLRELIVLFALIILMPE